MNTASRMESTSLPGRIQVSSSTWDLVKGLDSWQPTGGIQVKGKGLMETYLWEGQLPEPKTLTPDMMTPSIMTEGLNPQSSASSNIASSKRLLGVGGPSGLQILAAMASTYVSPLQSEPRPRSDNVQKPPPDDSKQIMALRVGMSSFVGRPSCDEILSHLIMGRRYSKDRNSVPLLGDYYRPVE